MIESFKPRTRIFELSVKLGDKTAELRPQIEAVLRRYKSQFEVRAVSEADAAYVVTAPFAIRTDNASKALIALDPEGKGAVEWKEITRKEARQEAKYLRAIVQRDAGIAAEVPSIRRARRSIDICILRLDREEIEGTSATAVRHQVGVRALITNTNTRR